MLMITFNEEKHTYTNPLGELYISVTTLIGKFKEPFDAQAVFAKNPSKYAGKEEYYLNLWKKGNDVSKTVGTSYHKAIEKYLLEGESEDLADYIKLFLENRVKKVKYKCEQLYYSDEYKVAGTCDLRIDNEDGTISLVDWKTNLNLRKKVYNNFTGILSNMQDSKINEYTIQLSIYALLLELSEGAKIKTLHIVWFDRENEKIELIKVDYLREIALKLLELAPTFL
jgi:hypothetical protein